MDCGVPASGDAGPATAGDAAAALCRIAGSRLTCESDGLRTWGPTGDIRRDSAGQGAGSHDCFRCGGIPVVAAGVSSLRCAVTGGAYTSKDGEHWTEVKLWREDE